MDKWGYNCLIEWKTLWEIKKLLVTSNFSFSHNVFKSCLWSMRQNEYLWSKRLILYQATIFFLRVTCACDKSFPPFSTKKKKLAEI